MVLSNEGIFLQLHLTLITKLKSTIAQAKEFLKFAQAQDDHQLVVLAANEEILDSLVQFCKCFT